MIRRHVLGLMAVAALACSAVPASARPRLADLHGHLALGYAKLFVSDAPGGSLSVGAGVDQPLGAGLRAGIDLGYHLLGSRTLEQGSVSSGLDYSLVEVLAQLRWTPPGGGSRVAIAGGPGLFVAHAELSSSPAAALFSREAIEATRLGFAIGATVARGGSAPVRVGLEAGLRVVPLETDTWTLATARVAIVY